MRAALRRKKKKGKGQARRYPRGTRGVDYHWNAEREEGGGEGGSDALASFSLVRRPFWRDVIRARHVKPRARSGRDRAWPGRELVEDADAERTTTYGGRRIRDEE